MDLSFSNTLISNYFSGDEEYKPVNELLFLHTHPLIKDNFITQIESKINSTTDLIDRRKIRGKSVDKLIDQTIRLGKIMPDLNEQNAPEVLDAFREINKICDQLLKQYNVGN